MYLTLVSVSHLLRSVVSLCRSVLVLVVGSRSVCLMFVVVVVLLQILLVHLLSII